MNMKPGSCRQLPAYDARQIEQLLKEEYRTAEITLMYYSYPMNDNRLLVEYSIAFFNNDEQARFFRKAFKKNGQWQISSDFRTVNCVKGVYSPGEREIEEMIKAYMES